MGNVLGTDDGGGGRRVRRLDGRVVYTTCPECGCGPGDCCTGGTRACGWQVGEGPTPPGMRLSGAMRSRIWLYANCVRDGHPFRADGPQFHDYTVTLPVTADASSANCDLLGWPAGPLFDAQRDPPGTEFPAITRETGMWEAAVSNGPATGGGQSWVIRLYSSFFREIPDPFGEYPGQGFTWDWAFNSVIRIRLNNFGGAPAWECGDFSLWPELGGLPTYDQGIYGMATFGTVFEEVANELVVQPVYSGACVIGWTIRARREVVARDTAPPQTVRGRYLFEFDGALMLENVAGCGSEELPSAICLGACCKPDGSCSQMTHAECLAAGGEWYPNQACADIECGCVPNGPCIVWGGVFTSAGGAAAARVVAWDGTDWIPLGEGFNQVVQSLCIHEGDLIAAGGFTASGANTTRGVARWNCDHWEELGNGIAGVVNRAKSIEIPGRGRCLVIVGNFTAGPIHNMAWLDASSNTWQPWTEGTNLEIYDVSANELTPPAPLAGDARDGIFAAGRFTQSGAGTNLILNNLGYDPQYQDIVMIEPTVGAGAAPNNRVRSVIQSLDIGGGASITIGGLFSAVGGATRGRIAVLRWDSTTSRYVAAGGPLSLNGGFFNGEVHFAVWDNNELGGNLYALGAFRFVSGAPTEAIARWNIASTSWSVPTAYSGTFFHGCWAAHPVTGVATLWLAGDTQRVIDGQSGRAAYLAPGGQVDPVAGHGFNGQAFAVIGFDFGSETPGGGGARPGGGGGGGCVHCRDGDTNTGGYDLDEHD